MLTVNCVTLLILEMLKSMDLNYYHFQAYSTPMLDFHSLYISMIETFSETTYTAYVKSVLRYIFLCFRQCMKYLYKNSEKCNIVLIANLINT